MELIERQSEIVMRWLREGEHEVVVAVFQSTDFAQHRLWKYLDRPGHPLREALLEMYRAIDRMVGEARALLGEGAAVAVVSDHGFGPHPTSFVRTDSVLQQAGLLVAGGAPGAARASPERCVARRRCAGCCERRSAACRAPPATGSRPGRPAPAVFGGSRRPRTGSRSTRPPRAWW